MDYRLHYNQFYALLRTLTSYGADDEDVLLENTVEPLYKGHPRWWPSKKRGPRGKINMICKEWCMEMDQIMQLKWDIAGFSTNAEGPVAQRTHKLVIQSLSKVHLFLLKK